MIVLTRPEKIEIEGLKTIHRLCKFGADHNMEGCSFTEIVGRMFSKIEEMTAQVNTLDEMLLNQGEALVKAKAQAVPEWNSVDDKEPPLGTMVLICWSDAPDVEPEKDYMDHDVDHGVNYWANYNDGDEPSHWMLLPKPVAQEQSHD